MSPTDVRRQMPHVEVAISHAPTKTVLIVDDEQPILELLHDVLEDAGYAVRTASNGRIALAIAQQYALHLVITDLMMPEMDGQALCLRLRADPRTSHLPILLMTAARHPQIQAPFNDLINKPFSIEDVIQQVQHHIP